PIALAYPDRVLAQARLRHAAGRAGHFLATPLGLVCLFALGLILRLVVAPSTGLQFDLDYFRTWTVRLTVLGPSHFYDSGFPADPVGVRVPCRRFRPVLEVSEGPCPAGRSALWAPSSRHPGDRLRQRLAVDGPPLRPRPRRNARERLPPRIDDSSHQPQCIQS